MLPTAHKLIGEVGSIIQVGFNSNGPSQATKDTPHRLDSDPAQSLLPQVLHNGLLAWLDGLDTVREYSE